MAVILQGDAITRLRELADESVHCVVTSPPYWGLRDYGTASWEGGEADCGHQNHHSEQGKNGDRADRTFTGAQNFYRDECGKCGAVRTDQQIGLESSPDEYIAKMVSVFREVRRVLRGDGTAWVNMGDSYVSTGGIRAHGWQPETNGRGEANSYPKRGSELIMPMARNRRRGGDADPKRRHSAQTAIYRGATAQGALKPKDLVGIPWRLAFALQADGWWLRQDIIWAKPNPMPESVTDRCTKAHEYVFLLSKSATYYYDADAIKEPASMNTHDRGSSPVNPKAVVGWASGNGSHSAIAHNQRGQHPKTRPKQNPSFAAALAGKPDERNKRSVWTVASQPFPEAHFATFPEELIVPCILAGCPEGGTVLDPFSGSGTTGVVALRYHRRYIGIELSAEYAAMSERRISGDSPLFNEVVTHAR